MSETVCIRLIIAGLVLAVTGLLLPEESSEWLRAGPIVVGFGLTLVASYRLLRLPRDSSDDDEV